MNNDVWEEETEITMVSLLDPFTIIYAVLLISSSGISPPSVLSTTAWKTLFQVNPIQTQMVRPGALLKNSSFRIPNFSFQKALHKTDQLLLLLLLLFKNQFWEIL